MSDARDPREAQIAALAARHLPPGSRLLSVSYDFSRTAWRVVSEWWDRRFECMIPEEFLDDRQNALIVELLRLGAPCAESTREGKRCWLHVGIRGLDENEWAYPCTVLLDPRGEPILRSVRIAGSVAGPIKAIAVRRRVSHETIQLLAVLARLKDAVSRGEHARELTVSSAPDQALRPGGGASDHEVRLYAAARLHAAYVSASGITSITFDDLDLGYLGIEEREFRRAVALYAGQEWTIDGLTLTPSRELIEKHETPATPAGVRVSQPKLFSAEITPRDVFISHASEDKDEIARPLAMALRDAGIAVWFDEFELRLGDSLRRSIEDGLRRCQHGVVILSHAFFRKKWPQLELDALIQLGFEGKRIMPIWHKLGEREVREYSPLLADRFAIASSDGMNALVDAIDRAIGKRTRDHESQDPREVACCELLQAAGKSEGHLYRLSSEQAGEWVRAGGRDFCTSAHERVLFLSAHETLLQRNLIRHESGKLYTLTVIGWERVAFLEHGPSG